MKVHVSRASTDPYVEPVPPCPGTIPYEREGRTCWYLELVDAQAFLDWIAGTGEEVIVRPAKDKPGEWTALIYDSNIE